MLTFHQRSNHNLILIRDLCPRKHLTHSTEQLLIFIFRFSNDVYNTYVAYTVDLLSPLKDRNGSKGGVEEGDCWKAASGDWLWDTVLLRCFKKVCLAWFSHAELRLPRRHREAAKKLLTSWSDHSLHSHWTTTTDFTLPTNSGTPGFTNTQLF